VSGKRISAADTNSLYTAKDNCPFCNLDNARILKANSHALAIFDAFPVSPGHTLILPKRHISSFFDATQEELSAMRDLLADPSTSSVARQGSLPLRPDGFNIGINDGEAAGQTVMHLHIHLIPRYAGDTQDPRVGVRWIMPEKAVYWR
jgi:diadenosine tetraphosphate (Ap4A) HIT family hydrolase